MSGPQVHWNGRMLPADEARVSVFDAGFLYGDGIYETMRAYSGRPFALGKHLSRLERSARAIDLALPDRAGIAAAVSETIRANDLESAIVRITVTRGRLGRRLDLSTSGEPSVLVAAEPFDRARDAERRRGVAVVSSRFVRLSAAPLAGVKSTNYQVSLFARNEAREAGAAEVLLSDESGDVVEAAAANVFAIEDRTVVTPPTRAGILGGITREIALGIARERGYPIVESTLSRPRIERADELFLTGTTIQVTPIVTLDGAPIAGGKPGPITLELLDAYLAAVAADTGATSERIR